MRALWSGSLSFGLIHIPVKLYSASKEQSLRFKLLDKHGPCPVSYARICRRTNKEISYEDIVRGYEYKKGDYVILTDEDLKRVRPRRQKIIEIVHFSDEQEIDPAYYEKPYYIEPDPKAQKAYVLLRAALKRAEKVAIARLVLRDKEYVTAIQPRGNALVLHQLRYQDEIRPVQGLRIPERASYSEQELQITLMLIKQLGAHFQAQQFHDTYSEELSRVIKARAKGQELSRTPLPPAPSPTSMRDLMTMLKKSLEQERPSQRPGSRRSFRQRALS